MGDDKITRNVARILAARQAELGVSLRQIEEMSGVTRMSACRILAGESAIPLSKFEDMARALGLIPWQVMREAEQADEATDENFGIESLEPPTPLHPHTQEENLPDFTKLAARKVANRPEWEARRALDDIGEENQDPVDY